MKRRLDGPHGRPEQKTAPNEPAWRAIRRDRDGHDGSVLGDSDRRRIDQTVRRVWPGAVKRISNLTVVWHLERKVERRFEYSRLRIKIRSRRLLRVGADVRAVGLRGFEPGVGLSVERSPAVMVGSGLDRAERVPRVVASDVFVARPELDLGDFPVGAGRRFVANPPVRLGVGEIQLGILTGRRRGCNDRQRLVAAVVGNVRTGDFPADCRAFRAGSGVKADFIDDDVAVGGAHNVAESQ